MKSSLTDLYCLTGADPRRGEQEVLHAGRAVQYRRLPRLREREPGRGRGLHRKSHERQESQCFLTPCTTFSTIIQNNTVEFD